jgi:hypothetical protein
MSKSVVVSAESVEATILSRRNSFGIDLRFRDESAHGMEKQFDIRGEPAYRKT